MSMYQVVSTKSTIQFDEDADGSIEGSVSAKLFIGPYSAVQYFITQRRMKHNYEVFLHELNSNVVHLNSNTLNYIVIMHSTAQDEIVEFHTHCSEKDVKDYFDRFKTAAEACYKQNSRSAYIADMTVIDAHSGATELQYSVTETKGGIKDEAFQMGR